MLVTNNPILRSVFGQLARRKGDDVQTQVGGVDE